MKTYAGLDVAEQETEICVINDDGEILYQGRCATEPEVIADVLKQHAPHFVISGARYLIDL